MFWRKRGTERKGGKKKAIKKIEGALWDYMVSQHGVTVDILQNLRFVECNGVIESRPAIMVRIFDPAVADKRSVAIEDYESLGGHPELILYEGYCRETSGQLDIHIETE